MAAASAYWPRTGRLESVATLPDRPGPRGARLARWGRRALRPDGGARRVDRDRREACDIAELVREALARFGPPSAIAADRWRAAELRDILDSVRVPRCPFHERGQGYQDGGQDVRQFRRAMAEGRVRPVESLLLASAAAEGSHGVRSRRQLEAREVCPRGPATAGEG